MGELLEKGYFSSSRGLLDQETRSLPSWMLIEIPRETIMLLALLGRRRHLNAQEQDHLEIYITESKLTPTRLNNSNGGSNPQMPRPLELELPDLEYFQQVREC
ncbi:hypothetical protein F2Q69_00031994 [Brassica cretica]|uniref:Uncharacterized protein n=1 Tax=Brassica cretica TaxID=69181 RepID=A0A8S9SAS6_BRACR|nr:hypothetical protein F2Q69_00031994 [Brassica cretica]